MKEDIEFQGIEKRVPYQVPDGFFDSITNKTLQNAKLREQKHRKNLTLWRTMAVAASLAAIVLFGYLKAEYSRENQTDVIVMDALPPIVQKPEINLQSTVKAPPKALSPKVKEKIASKEDKTEVLADIISDLTDEELLELDAMYKTDPMIGELEQ